MHHTLLQTEYAQGPAAETLMLYLSCPLRQSQRWTFVAHHLVCVMGSIAPAVLLSVGSHIPESCLGKINKYGDVFFLGEATKILKPVWMYKVVQGHHWL